MLQAVCRVTGQPFIISDKEQAFCETNGIPLPDISPLEHMRIASTFTNAIFLYQNTCDFSQKPILSAIPPNQGWKNYDIDIWSSDQWDAMDYGRDYDFGRPFFDQFYDLLRAVPHPNVSAIKSTLENSDYTNGIAYAKNCYLVFIATNVEDCLFSMQLTKCKNVSDSLLLKDCELCFGSRNLTNCYRLAYSDSCENCSTSSFLFNCKSCTDCYGCSNLVNKQYYFDNQPYSKEEYQAKVTAIDLGSFAVLSEQQQKYEQIFSKVARKYMVGSHTENSSGNYLNNTQNCINSYFVADAQDVENGLALREGTKDSMRHGGFGMNAELIYTCQGVGANAYNLKFCVSCYSDVRDLEYCFYTGFGSSDCFGCVGLKKKQYCIFNKQYTKETYHVLVTQIKDQMRASGEYGQFFPTTLSPFAYNKSEAYSYFPLSREAALAQGFAWENEEENEFMQTYIIPDHIKDVTDEILHQVLSCAKTGKKYRIIAQELATYRDLNMPIPRIAPLERIKDKLTQNILKPLQKIACSNCQTALESVYDPNEHPVYCETCYQNCLQ
jgi:hypothetical protein